MRRLLCGVVAACVAAACGSGPWPSVVGPRDVSAAGGAPRVRRVRDLGAFDSLPQGTVPGTGSDGTFVVGEYVLIEGSDFGKLPTVLIGGRPAKALARTSGGGIITQIPAGVLAGSIAVEVSHPRGKHALEIPVKRYGVVAQGDADTLHLVDVRRDGAEVLPQRLAVQNPRSVRFSADGSMAYVASGVARGAEGTAGASGKLSVVSMTAPGGPKVVHEIKVDSRFVVSLAVAERAPLLAVVGEGEVQLFSLGEPRTPAPYDTMVLPGEVQRKGVVAADLDPTGKLLAILFAEGNELGIIDVSRPEAPAVVESVSVLPGERLPLVRDMRFSVDGGTLWVVSGDNALSISAGHQPTRLTAVNVNPPPAEGTAGRRVEVARTAEIPGATAPLRIATARGQPLASGTTIRTPPEKAAVFVTTVNPKVFQLAGLDLFKPEARERAVALLKPIAEPGMLVRTDVEGGGGPLFSAPTVLSSIDLSPDSQMLLATSCRVDLQASGAGSGGLALEFGVTITPLWGAVKPEFVRLGEMSPGAFQPPFVLGHVRIQP